MCVVGNIQKIKKQQAGVAASILIAHTHTLVAKVIIFCNIWCNIPTHMTQDVDALYVLTVNRESLAHNAQEVVWYARVKCLQVPRK
jgi:hypothetical protein